MINLPGGFIHHDFPWLEAIHRHPSRHDLGSQKLPRIIHRWIHSIGGLKIFQDFWFLVGPNQIGATILGPTKSQKIRNMFSSTSFGVGSLFLSDVGDSLISDELFMHLSICLEPKKHIHFKIVVWWNHFSCKDLVHHPMKAGITKMDVSGTSWGLIQPEFQLQVFFHVMSIHRRFSLSWSSRRCWHHDRSSLWRPGRWCQPFTTLRFPCKSLDH